MKFSTIVVALIGAVSTANVESLEGQMAYMR